MIEILSDDLNAVIEWASVWQLGVALNKCTVLHLGRKNASNIYKVGNIDIPSADNVKDLGVTISNYLQCHDHCSAIVAKANSKCSLILKGFYNKNPWFLLRLFRTYVLPVLEYWSPVWSPSHLGDI